VIRAVETFCTAGETIEHSEAESLDQATEYPATLTNGAVARSPAILRETAARDALNGRTANGRTLDRGWTSVGAVLGRIRSGILSPMGLLRAAVVILNLTPLRSVFRRIYAFGLARLVAALATHPAVFCIFGCGSYFEGEPTYGLSDIDLIIVLDEQVERADGAPREIGRIYQRQWCLFPFLGRWHEKAANLVFLSDLKKGFPAAESFSARLKLGRLTSLYGKPIPFEIGDRAITTSEQLVELDILVRAAVVNDLRVARRMWYWKRIFSKTIELLELLQLEKLARELREHPELTFLTEADTRLFFRRCEPGRLFSLLIRTSRRAGEAVRAREPSVRVELAEFMRSGAPEAAQEKSTLSPAIAALERDGLLTVKHILSVPIGLAPRLMYFSIDQQIPLLELHGSAFEGINRLRVAMRDQPETAPSVILLAEDTLFIATRQYKYTDIVPLNPLLMANIYAAAHDSALVYEMPASVFDEQDAHARAIFGALVHVYRANQGTMRKLSYPCVFREDDGKVIEDMVRILRIYLASSDGGGVLIRRWNDLFEFIRRRHPECREFLAELQSYRESLWVDPKATPAANNLHRCIHQFMWQMLSGADTISLDAPHQNLKITVGVITRNRAEDLAEMLESLTRQIRPPDEVLVVDNGSTDGTQAALDRFRQRLPIRSIFLAEANIPGARNLVIEQAAHDIISFIDDDCISEPGWLAGVERGFLRADNIGIVGGWVRHEPADRPSVVDSYYQVFHHAKQ
jgi:hypothetical protein